MASCLKPSRLDLKRPPAKDALPLTAPTKAARGSVTKITGEDLDCDYADLYEPEEAASLFKECEKELTYLTGDLARVKVYGQWYPIPRKQVAHGDASLRYSFSGVCVHARPWTPLLLKIRRRVEEQTGVRFNFVLINRYKDGKDHIGEHKDDETQMVPKSPIASFSLGQERDFVFRHALARGRNAPRKDLRPVHQMLTSGSLLVMNHPTNTHWYHSLPIRKNVEGVRINMTFRHFL